MFRFFRRYQKSFIVVGGVILMFVFTVGDSLTAWLRSQEGETATRQPGDIAVTWDDGELTEGELDRLVQRRMLVDGFVRSVYQAGTMQAAEAGREDLQPRVMPIGLVGSDMTRATLEEEVVLTHILAERGRKLGIHISDAAIIDYINELGRGELGKDSILAILSQFNAAGRPISVEILYEALRHELLAAATMQAYGISNSNRAMFAAELPLNRWHEWRIINDRAVFEAAAIDTSASMIDVPEPTEEQLREFYEEHKNTPPFPNEILGAQLPPATPGFKIPRKIKLQYLRANYQEFVERFEAEVTDEEVKEYYEENKFRFVKADSFDDILNDQQDTPAEGEPQPEGQSPEGDPAETGSAAPQAEETAEDPQQSDTQPQEPPAPAEPSTEGDAIANPDVQEAPMAPEAAEDGAATAEDESSESAEPESAEPESAAPESAANEEGGEPTAEQPADEQPADEQPADEEPAEEEPADGESQGATAGRTSPFRLTAYQEAGEQASGEGEQEQDADQSSEPEAAEPDAQDEQAGEASSTSEGESAQEEGAEASDETEVEDRSATADATPTAETQDASAEADEPPPVEYQPLEEVADEIRRNIAEQRFFNEIDDTMNGILTRLNPAFNRYLGEKLDAEATDQQMPEPPEVLVDLAPLAQEHNLEYEETGELNAYEMRDSDVGRSVEQQRYNAPVWQVMFGAQLDTYEPVLSADAAQFGDRFLSMKTSDEPERVPSFEEVKDQVTREWKEAEAAKLALEKAKQLAKEAREAGVTLKDFFADNAEVEVTQTPPFTRLTQGDVAPTTGQPEYRLSQPEGLKNVGLEFLNEAFDLDAGEVTALLNHDHSIAYVLRLADEYESTEQLRSDFLEQANFWPGRSKFYRDNVQQMRAAVLSSMLDNVNIEWQRPATETDEE